ncbi:YuiA family protein [Bacillus sp. FJAT-44742]|uniref:YuiA family protein n=1 Tax=Bacillus sp. FJAT-44742 TaxID=2014005 RepID=UPI0018E22BCB
MVYYQKIPITRREKSMSVSQKAEKFSEKCVYCEGRGYFQLILGGSETCDNCGGNGITSNVKR